MCLLHFKGKCFKSIKLNNVFWDGTSVKLTDTTLMSAESETSDSYQLGVLIKLLLTGTEDVSKEELENMEERHADFEAI